MRVTFGDILHAPVDDRGSSQPQVWIRNGGRGLRTPDRVAAAALVAMARVPAPVAARLHQARDAPAVSSVAAIVAEVRDRTPRVPPRPPPEKIVFVSARGAAAGLAVERERVPPSGDGVLAEVRGRATRRTRLGILR